MRTFVVKGIDFSKKKFVLIFAQNLFKRKLFAKDFGRW